jgi:hypothetical protein
VLDEVVNKWDGWDGETYQALAEWWGVLGRKKACVKKLRGSR